MAFRAKFPGRAVDGRPIRPGDLIESAGRGYQHAGATAVFRRYDRIEATVGRAAADEFSDSLDSGDRDWTSQDEVEYQKGLADGRRYQAEKKVYGQALADAFAAEDEFVRYWKYGEDY